MGMGAGRQPGAVAPQANLGAEPAPTKDQEFQMLKQQAQTPQQQMQQINARLTELEG